MRVKVGDPNSFDCEVYLNGVKQEEYLLADDELGIVHLIERHWRTGEIVKRPDSPYSGTGYVEVKGKVEIRGLSPQPGTFNHSDLLEMLAWLGSQSYVPSPGPIVPAAEVQFFECAKGCPEDLEIDCCPLEVLTPTEEQWENAHVVDSTSCFHVSRYVELAQRLEQEPELKQELQDVYDLAGKTRLTSPGW